MSILKICGAEPGYMLKNTKDKPFQVKNESRKRDKESFN